MLKRPVCFAACVLIGILQLCRFFGVVESVPGYLKRSGLEDYLVQNTQDHTVFLLGRICEVQQLQDGQKLCFDQCTLYAMDPGSGEERREESKKTDISEKQKSSDAYMAFSVKDGFLVMARPSGGREDYLPGSWFVMKGEWHLPEAASNPGQFDFLNYYSARNIILLLQNAEPVRTARSDNTRTFLEEIQIHLLHVYRRILPQEDAAALSAITLGEKSLLTPERRDLLQEGGIGHILAISGLHISLIGRGIWKRMREHGLGYVISGLASSGILFMYCLMIGFSSSSFRAFLMFLFWSVSQMLGCTYDALTALAAASVIVLVRSPEYLDDSGFYLSFSCILSLQLLSPLVNQILPGGGRKKKRRRSYRKEGSAAGLLVRLCTNTLGAIRQGLTASLAIFLGTLPVICYYYFQITPYAPVVNLIVIPCMPVLMICGLAGCAAGSAYPAAGTFLAAPAHFVLQGFDWLCRLEQTLPGSIYVTGRPGTGRIVLYYAALTVLLLLMKAENTQTVILRFFRNGEHREKRQKNKERRQKSRKTEQKRRHMDGRKRDMPKRIVYVIFLGGLVCMMITSPRPDGLRVVFADVGQGDGILVQTSDMACLIDCGSSSTKQVWTYRMEKLIKYYGIRQLDYIFLSHGDQDHSNGISQMLENSRIVCGQQTSSGIHTQTMVVTPGYEKDEKLRKLTDTAQYTGIQAAVMCAGREMVCADLTLRCLYPSDDADSSYGGAKDEEITEDRNNGSMILLLRYRGLGILFTGDLGKEGEDRLLELYMNETDILDADVLKVGHHGSRNATGADFLKAVSPEYAVISCGKNNRYGHPSPETLSRLAEENCRIYRTDEQGAVVLEMDQEGKLKLSTYK